MIGGIDQLFTGATLLAVLAYIGYQLKSIPSFIWEHIKKHLVFTIHLEDSSEVYYYFEQWLWDYHEHLFKNVKVQLESEVRNVPLYTNNDNNGQRIKIIHYDDTFILKYKGKRLLINKGREKLENATDPRNLHFNNFTISGWFAKKQMIELMDEILQHYKEVRKHIPCVYVNTTYGDWKVVGKLSGKNIENIVLKDKKMIMDDITEFKGRESWYNERNLPYKRGYLFSGRPGNGKTSLALSLAMYFKSDIYILNLNDLEKDTQLIYTFSEMKPNSILLIEDADVSSGNRTNKKSVSFSAILNCMDGVFSRHGLITIITTNHSEKLDPAMIRAGRIDVKINFENPDITDVENYLGIFYSEKQVTLPSYNKSFAMADIQEICVRNQKLEGAITELTS